MAMDEASGSEVMLNRVQTKDNIALAALLQTKEACWENNNSNNSNNTTTDPAQQHLLVATAHIHWDPEFCDVKLVQTMMLVSWWCKLKGTVAVHGFGD